MKIYVQKLIKWPKKAKLKSKTGQKSENKKPTFDLIVTKLAQEIYKIILWTIDCRNSPKNTEK